MCLTVKSLMLIKVAFIWSKNTVKGNTMKCYCNFVNNSFLDELDVSSFNWDREFMLLTSMYICISNKARCNIFYTTFLYDFYRVELSNK